MHLERVIGEKLNDALLRVPAETENLNERHTNRGMGLSNPDGWEKRLPPGSRLLKF